MVGKDFSEFEDAELIEQIQKRGFFVSDDNPDERECEECQHREFDPKPDEAELEEIHYLVVGGKKDEAIAKVKDMIYRVIGKIS
jgi:DNA-binding transcriptional regulator YhcF (GntR family)